MFYSSQLLSRKTALGICWLASHLESKRLKRAQVFEVSIAQSCDSIINPEAPLALRLSGQLLLGVVRIYQRKLAFLETDAKNAIDGLQRKDGGSHNVDLPDGGTAPEVAITLPDADTGLFAGAELFPSFAMADPGAAAGGEGASSLAARLAGPGTTADSLTYADDISDVLGSSRWTASEERFDLVGGDDIDRRFSAELERLRSAAAVEAPRDAATDLFFDAPVDDSYGPGGMDEIMEPPADDLFVMPERREDAGPTPGSIGGASLPGAAGFGFTPPSLGLSDALPDLGGGPGSAPTTRREKATPGSSGRAKQRKKKKIQIDVAHDGSAATQLPSDEIRRLLNNRAPLLKRRGLGDAAAAPPGPPPRPFDVRSQSEAARDSYLYRPACTDRLDPQLLAVFNRALGVSDDTGRPAKGRKAAAAVAEAPAAATPAEQPFVASPGGGGAVPSFGLPGPSPAGTWGGSDGGGGYFDDGGSGGGYFPEPDLIETTQPGGEEGAGAAADERRLSTGRGGSVPALVLAPVEGGRRMSLGDLQEEEEEARQGGGDGLTADGFTARTKLVMEHLASRFAAGPSPGDKRRRSGGTEGGAIASVSLDGLVVGRPRLEACRWFFEALVLRNKGYVDLHQTEPYGEISITPMAKLREAAAIE